jgi:uroporphyrinogen-III synthase
VQLYGNDPNLTLMRFLREREAEVSTVAPYVYGNAADDATVHSLLERMAAGEWTPSRSPASCRSSD